MNATQEMWLVIANGQKIMSREMLTMAQQARSADVAAQCVDLANISSYIESRARGMALLEDKQKGLGKCVKCGQPLYGWRTCAFC